MKIRKVGLAGGLIALVFALVVGPVASGGAFGVTVPAPGAPPILNVLPSVIKGALPVSGGTQAQNMLAVMLYRFAQSPEFWKAAAAKTAGTATPAQVATVTNITKVAVPPATRTAGLIRGAGAVAAAVSGLQFGTSVGNGVMQVFGVNSEGLVCTSIGAGVGQDMVGLLTGVNCTAYNRLAPEYVPNAGLVAGASWPEICAPGLGCVQLLKLALYPYPDTNYQMVCFTSTASEGPGIQLELDGVPERYPGGLYQSAFQGTNCGNALLWALQGGYPVSKQVTGYRFTSTPSAPFAQPVQTLADPERVLRCVTTATDGTFRTGVSAPYHESAGALPTPVCEPLPDGLTLSTVVIFEVVDGVATELWRQNATPEFTASKELAPECADGTCQLDLLKGSSSCFGNTNLCAGWMTDPARDTSYSCRFGTHAVALSECFVYAPSFDPANISTGNTLGDPTTGAPVTGPAGSPVGTDGAGYAAPATSADTTRECFPTGWAVLNPVEWVMKPVQCALNWAFVPRGSVLQGTFDRIKTSFTGTTPGKVIAAITAWSFVPPVQGCDGIIIDVFFLGPPFHIMGACDGSMLAHMADFARLFGNLSVTVVGVVAITRYLAAIFGFVGVGST